MPTRRTKLTSIGDELALVLDQEALTALGYTAETEVELWVEAGCLVIEPVRDAGSGGRPPPPARRPGA